VHSLTGVVPVGVFLLAHLWTNAQALSGQSAFDAAVSEIHHLPYLPAIEVFGIFLPLSFHALYGVKLALEAKVNVGP
jgi:succinate dehydrogenase/fumarate reductase cytochrome b subunit